MTTEKPEVASAVAGERSLKDIDKRLGAVIRSRREEKPLSVAGLATAAGILPDELMAYEAGEKSVDPVHLRSLARALGVRIYVLIDEMPLVSVPDTGGWIREVERWFSECVTPHERVFLGVARRLTGDIEQARDLVHEVYARVLKADTWTRVQEPRAYILRAIKNLGLNQIQKSRVVTLQPYAVSETLSYADKAPDAQEALTHKEEIAALMRAIESLPPRCQTVIRMRKLDEMRPLEIAKALGITLSAVEKNLARGMVMLTQILDSETLQEDASDTISQRSSLSRKAD